LAQEVGAVLDEVKYCSAAAGKNKAPMPKISFENPYSRPAFVEQQAALARRWLMPLTDSGAKSKAVYCLIPDRRGASLP